MATRIRKAKAADREPTLHAVEPEVVALRAYEIYESGGGGDPIENWLRAEHELATQTLQLS